MALQVAYKAGPPHLVNIQELGDGLLAGYTKIGEIPFTEADDPLDMDHSEPDHDRSRVIYDWVRDMMYAEGVEDMQSVVISLDTAYAPVTGVTVAPAAHGMAPLATVQLVPTVTPAGATDKGVSYASNDDAIATVSATGLVTAHAVGEAEITVTTEDGEFTAVSVITVA
jgi:hypothetical protein